MDGEDGIDLIIHIDHGMVEDIVEDGTIHYGGNPLW
jgi:hypothetical protein